MMVFGNCSTIVAEYIIQKWIVFLIMLKITQESDNIGSSGLFANLSNLKQIAEH